MTPSSLEILGSIRWSFQEKIIPELGDPLAQSYARSIVNALDALEARLLHEGEVLTEEIADLRAVLDAQRSSLPGDLRATVDDALVATSVPTGSLDVAAATRSAARLRGAAEALIVGLPGGARTALRGYLTRQLERERRFEPTTPRSVL